MKRAFSGALPFFLVVAMTLLLASCGSAPAPPPAKKTVQVEAPPPREEWHRFPKSGMIETKLVPTQLMGKPFMPGGTLGRYKQANTEYEMFICRLSSAEDAALLLGEWKAVMTNPQLVYSFGGYFGEDAGRPAFIFPKGSWIAGVVGLPQKEAERKASLLAAYLD
ncbi:MAG: hypothetical protein ACE141_11120 [Bryobacteraceae bacterium]